MTVYKRSLWFLLPLICLYSCWQASPGQRGILSVNQMKLAMWDMIQADQFAAAYLAKDSAADLKQQTRLLYQKVFALHHIDSAKYFKSFEYFKSHPEDYKILLDSLSAYANRERDNRFYLNRTDTLTGLK